MADDSSEDIVNSDEISFQDVIDFTERARTDIIHGRTRPVSVELLQNMWLRKIPVEIVATMHDCSKEDILWAYRQFSDRYETMQ